MKTAAAATALLAALSSAGAAAADYPTRPVRLVIPFVPGGSNDIVGRVVAQQLSERLGKPVVIDNRGGAGGIIGMQAAASAAPDGYTLLVTSATSVKELIARAKKDPGKLTAGGTGVAGRPGRRRTRTAR